MKAIINAYAKITPSTKEKLNYTIECENFTELGKWLEQEEKDLNKYGYTITEIEIL